MKETTRIHLRIPCYIFQFLTKLYGPDPHIVKQHDHTVIKNALIYQGLYADALPPSVMLPNTEVLLIIHGGKKLYTAINAGRHHIPSRNYFFQFEFYSAMDQWCLGLTQTKTMNRKEALRHFLAYYNIGEDLFPEEHAYRYLTSFITKRKELTDRAKATPLPIDDRPRDLNRKQLRLWDNYLAAHRRAERELEAKQNQPR